MTASERLPLWGGWGGTARVGTGFAVGSGALVGTAVGVGTRRQAYKTRPKEVVPLNLRKSRRDSNLGYLTA
jgi:hypothetical protein